MSSFQNLSRGVILKIFLEYSDFSLDSEASEFVDCSGGRKR